MISQIIDEKSIRKLKELLDDSSKITITCHQGPDGDAIGSSLAAMHVLTSLGKEVRIVAPDGFLGQLRQLPGAKEVVDASRYPDFARQLLDEADLIICLDYNLPTRTGKLADALLAANAPKVMIDHHLEPGDFANVIISHPEMAATCVLLFRVFCRLELFNFINKAAAECLLAGILTDTGNLSYNVGDPELFTIVAELVRKGADKEQLTRHLFMTTSVNCMRLNAYALLKKMEIFSDEHAALIVLSREELNRFHYTKGDTEGLVNRPLEIPGIRYSCFLREERDLIKVSMRSLGAMPVNEVCSEHFGGGGHLNAAGGEFYGTLEECADLFRTIVKENTQKYKKELNQ
ncbi:MAG: DHH family phosphoesterase [Muribaculaceae bacterium]|nr:DHH family phosphoesterase [Muribaculaceae bacterium]